MPANSQTCKMKKVLLVLWLAMLGCSFPVQVTLGTPTPAPTATLAAESTPTPPPLVTPQPGTDQNPLILALIPAPRPPQDVIAAGERLAAFIQSQTGYRVVTVAPASETALLDSLAKGNAHIVTLSPFGYVAASDQNLVAPLLARVRDGKIFYGAQIIFNRDKPFTSFYDIERKENTADPTVALKQFNDRKACWSDNASPSGYVVPLGVLKQAGVQIRSEAFLAGQPNVVRAVYSDDICDFGGTFIDARDAAILEADYPDVMEKVLVAWRIPEIIPYENISIATSLPFEMRRVIQRAFIDFMFTPEGRAAMQTLYGFDEVRIVEDDAYVEFVKYVKASGVDLRVLIK
jgi:ABC-type phosphate/phosphonate transport system substrate-binding protein